MEQKPQRTVQVRGSEFVKDLWTMKTFRPGAILWEPPKDAARTVSPAYRQLVVRVPSRLSAVILDMTKIAPSGHDTLGDPGSISFGVDLHAYAEVTLTDEPGIRISADSERPLIVQHAGMLMSQLLKLDEHKLGLELRAWGHGYDHVGLGSTANVMDAIGLGVNALFGNPIDDRWLRKFLTFNYLEEGVDQGDMIPGFATGGAGAVARFGGVCIVSSGAELVYRSAIPDGSEIVIGIPPMSGVQDGKKGKGIATSEVEIPSIDIIRHYERFNASRFCYWVLMEMMPALEMGDLRKVGDAIWDILLTGSKGTPTIVSHGTLMPLQITMELRQEGIEVAFMSSVGPAVAAIMSADKKSRAVSVFERHGCRIVSTKPNNVGLELVEARE